MRSFMKNFFSSALGAMVGVGLAFFGLVIVVPMVISMVLAGPHHEKNEGIEKNSILHLDIRGQITEKRHSMNFEIFGEHSIFNEDHALGLYELNKAIDSAKSDKRISGIYLEIHSFDGGWASLTSLRRHIEEFAKSGKWVYAYSDNMDEKGYYLASAANHIFMEPYGELEFNGLVVQEMFLKGLLDKLEVQPEVFRVGRFKAAIEPLVRDQMSNENREQNEALIGDIWGEVRKAAASVAKVDEARVDQMAAKLEIVSAEAAKNAKLIEGTLFQDELEDKLRDATVGADYELELVTPGQLLRENKERKHSGKKIAVIFAEGEIHAGESGQDSIGSEGLRDDIEEAKADDDVAAIVLRVNSPGGDALASDVIWREVRTSDDELPIVVSMGDVAASGGYYIAAAGRYIFAEPTTITGSIGVFGILFNSEKFFKDKAGVRFDSAMTHPYADIGTMARSVKPFESQVIQGQVERTYKRFLDVVQDGRGYEERKDLENIAEGRVWSGLRAKELGLVDELGGLEQAIAKAAEFAEIKDKDYRIEIYPAEVDPLKHLIERFTEQTAAKILGPSLVKARDLSQTALGPLTAKPGVYTRLPFDFKIH
jgi:protease-4